MTLEVRRWYVMRYPHPETGEMIERTHTDTLTAGDVDEARKLYHAARRRRWVPIGAIDSGIEAVGFKVDEPELSARLMGPSEAVERLRSAGAASAADALERSLQRGREAREARSAVSVMP